MRILVTRPEETAAELCERIRALGHEPVACPLVRLEPLGEGPVAVAGYDWVVVTSRTGAAELARRAAGPLPRVAAIGPGTAAALAERGIEAALVPGISTQEGLVAAFPRPAGRVLFAGAEGARRVVVEELGADFVALYRTVEAQPVALPAAELAVVASPSAARALAAALQVPGSPPAPLVVSIGPQTSAAVREAGLSVAAEARTHDLEGLVAAVVELAGRVGGTAGAAGAAVAP